VAQLSEKLGFAVSEPAFLPEGFAFRGARLAPNAERGILHYTDGVRAFTVKYYDGSAWQDNWDSTVQNNVLPKAVEVTIEFKGAAGDADWQTSRVLLIPCGQNNDVSTSSGGTP
jgi:hypothetical protein